MIKRIFQCNLRFLLFEFLHERDKESVDKISTCKEILRNGIMKMETLLIKLHKTFPLIANKFEVRLKVGRHSSDEQ